MVAKFGGRSRVLLKDAMKNGVSKSASGHVCLTRESWAHLIELVERQIGQKDITAEKKRLTSDFQDTSSVEVVMPKS